MDFYISAKWHLKDVVIEMKDFLLKKGHKVPVDWAHRAFKRDYEDFEHSSIYATEEVKAIMGSDVLIHLSDGGGKGKYVDLGIAICCNENNKKPLIYVVGSRANESQFYFHPHVKRVIVDNPLDSLEQIIEDVQKINE